MLLEVKPTRAFTFAVILTKQICRFSCENSTHVFIQKPVFNALALMGLLGQTDLLLADNISKDLSVLATRNKRNSVSVLLANVGQGREVVKLVLKYLPEVPQAAKFFVYKITNNDTNPRERWHLFGEPKCPDHDQVSVCESW